MLAGGFGTGGFGALLGAQGFSAGGFGFAGARLQAQLAGLVAGVLQLAVGVAGLGLRLGDGGALAGQVGQVFGFGLVAVLRPDAVGAGQGVGGGFEFERGAFGHGRCGGGLIDGAAGFFKRGVGRVGAAGSEQGGGAGGQQGGGAKALSGHGDKGFE